MSRDSIGYSDRFLTWAMESRRLFLCGSGYNRWVWRKGTNGLWIQGWLGEPTATQVGDHSRALNNWSLGNATVPITDATAPDGTATADILHEDATNNMHRAYNIVAGSVIGTVYCQSAFLKANNRTWAFLHPSANGLPAYMAWFDLANGVVGTKGANIGASGIIESPYATDWWRCWCTWATTSNPTYQLIAPATGNGVDSYQGLNQDSIYVWGTQWELGTYPSSHIINDGVATVVRAADGAIRLAAYPFPDARRFSMPHRILCPSHTPAADLEILRWSDGTANNKISWYAESGTGKLKVTSTVAGVAKGSVVVDKVISDGGVLDLYHAIEPGKLYAAVVDNGAKVDAFSDSDVDVATGLQHLDLYPFGGVHGELRPPIPDFLPSPYLDPMHRQPLVIVGA